MSVGNTQQAGDFATWLRITSKPTPGSRSAGEVPCGECTACCRASYFIHIQPDETRALDRIPDRLLFDAPGLPHGHVVMGYDDHGHCPMFVDGGCSIYDDRPQTCRDYDCRIFAATGVELTDDEKAEIVTQTQRWRFETNSDHDRARQTALRMCAGYLRDHAHHLPAGSVPKNPTHLAMLAIDVHDAFLAVDDSGATYCVEPELDVIAGVLEASMQRTRSSDL